MKIVLCTKDRCIQFIFERFTNPSTRVLPWAERCLALLASENASLYIDAVPDLSDEDWEVLLRDRPSCPHYVMVRRALREEDWRRATDAALEGFLFAPVPVCLCRLQEENWLTHLIIPPSETAVHDYPEIPVGPSVTYLPYLRAVKISTESGDAHVDLTINESSLLQLFLHNPNRIISRQEISALIWRGIAHPASVATLVGRLRNKLGPAGKWIVGRRQGGYIYRKPE